MPSRNISVEARERLRVQQEAEAKAVAAYGAAEAKLEATVVRRADVLAAQDELVRDAESDLAESAARLVEVSGFDRALLILGTAKGVLRRQLAAVKRGGAV
jgi:hypothetical protein